MVYSRAPDFWKLPSKPKLQSPRLSGHHRSLREGRTVAGRSRDLDAWTLVWQSLDLSLAEYVGLISEIPKIRDLNTVYSI